MMIKERVPGFGLFEIIQLASSAMVRRRVSGSLGDREGSQARRRPVPVHGFLGGMGPGVVQEELLLVRSQGRAG